MSRAALPDGERFRSDEVRLGYVSGVFGTSGEVRLYLYNPTSTLTSSLSEVTLVSPEGQRQSVSLSVRSGAGKRILGRLGGVSSPELARARIGHELVVAKTLLPEPEEDTYYHHELIGLPVVSQSGDALGTLRAVHSNTEIDLWEVRGGGTTLYIPAVAEEVVEVRVGECVVVSDAESE